MDPSVPDLDRRLVRQPWFRAACRGSTLFVLGVSVITKVLGHRSVGVSPWHVLPRTVLLEFTLADRQSFQYGINQFIHVSM
ncbi:hypothetical protein BDV36DRAFT_212504 [Aspergillus pseudocaelatus]|uniref:Uncharacterized protein n=1 Tax=Aspergillus pseudocaelatus TaxID=1825620 RepID=A0ABQ6WGB3_9EURO|nr:hypothetical protein BDV36DRAFT_212504 [Aspergillus pseudocaelatus]